MHIPHSAPKIFFETETQSSIDLSRLSIGTNSTVRTLDDIVWNNIGKWINCINIKSLKDQGVSIGDLIKFFNLIKLSNSLNNCINLSVSKDDVITFKKIIKTFGLTEVNSLDLEYPSIQSNIKDSEEINDSMIRLAFRVQEDFLNMIFNFSFFES